MKVRQEGNGQWLISNFNNFVFSHVGEETHLKETEKG